MEYRKFKADLLFNGTELNEENSVLITDTSGKIENIVHVGEAGEEVEILNGILTPGFINIHCHLELSHLRNVIQEKKGLVDFVFSVVTNRHFEENKILEAIKTAEEEMLENGIVAVGDICNNALTLKQKGEKNLCYYNFIETSGWNPAIAKTRFEKSKLFFDEFIQKRQNASIVPHAPYSVSMELWGKITPLFKEKVVCIHNQETQGEDDFFLNGTGSLINMYKMMNIDNSFYTPKKVPGIQTYFKYFDKASSVILVHNTFMKQVHLDYINKNTHPEQMLSFCLCPNANLYIEDTLPPVEMLLKNNCNIVIGTDSLASNHELNILAELKTISINFPEIATEILLRWATKNGAKALQLDNDFGSFDPGKRPGVVLIENVPGGKLTSTSIAKRII